MPSMCLAKQTLQDYEWLISSPTPIFADMRPADPRVSLFEDPPRREGDFYRLNGAWNNMIRSASGELLVFLCDHVWFEPEALEQFWAHYEDDKMRGVSSIGHHFRKILWGKPQLLWAFDKRPAILDCLGDGDQWTMKPTGMELAFAALPKKQLLEVGGFDEEYDKFFGVSEKEACLRMSKLGCTFILDRTRMHRNYTHDREWTPAEQKERYAGANALFKRHREEIEAGTRVTIPWERP